MKQYRYEPGNGTLYILWAGELESPYDSECCNVLIWLNRDKGTSSIFTFPKSRHARVRDITDQLKGSTVFQGDVAAIAGFVKSEMDITMHDTEGTLFGYDERGRWVG
jgi:hypothetical protein